jgi:hypothetical protein
LVMMMMMKNMKYSRWVGNDYEEEQEVLTWVGDDDDEEHEILMMGW